MGELEEGIKGLRDNSLTSLDLSLNLIGAEGTKSIAAVLEKNTSLTSLDLRGNSIGAEGAKSIAAVLENNTSLTSLDLSLNAIGAEGAKSIAAVLENNTSLTSLDLSFNAIGDEGAKSIAAGLENNTSLSSLDLGENSIGDEGAKSIAVVLENNTSLSSLDLGENSIGAEGAKSIAAVLEKNTSLTSLDLSLNAIGDEGAKSIAAGLEKNTSLTSLNLRNNRIGAEGAKSIAAVLEKNTSLSSLDLGDNSIGAEGAKSIAAVLENNTSLTSLNLVANRIGDKGAKSIAAVLEKNTSLTSLYLRNNVIGAELQKKIASFIERNCKIRDDFVTLVKGVVVGRSDQRLALLEKMQGVPVVHQSYAMAQIIKEVSDLDKQKKDINGHLEIIKFLLDNKVPVLTDVLEAVKEANNPQIESLIQSHLNLNPNPESSSNLSVTQQEQLKISQAQECQNKGDLAAALTHYQEALAMEETLVPSVPLSVSSTHSIIQQGPVRPETIIINHQIADITLSLIKQNQQATSKLEDKSALGQTSNQLAVDQTTPSETLTKALSYVNTALKQDPEYKYAYNTKGLIIEQQALAIEQQALTKQAPLAIATTNDTQKTTIQSTKPLAKISDPIPAITPEITEELTSALTQALDSFNQALKYDPDYLDAKLHAIEIETKLAQLEPEPVKKTARLKEIALKIIEIQKQKKSERPNTYDQQKQAEYQQRAKDLKQEIVIELPKPEYEIGDKKLDDKLSELSKTIELLMQRVSATEQELGATKQQLSTLKETVAEHDKRIAEVEKDMAPIRNNAEILEQIFEHKKSDLAVKKQLDQIKADPLLNQFYQDLCWQLNATYIASQTIETGMVANNKTGNIGYLGKLVKTAGEFTPLVGVGVKLIGDILLKVDKIKQSKMVSRYAHLVKDSREMSELAENIARTIVFHLSKMEIKQRQSKMQQVRDYMLQMTSNLEAQDMSNVVSVVQEIKGDSLISVADAMKDVIVENIKANQVAIIEAAQDMLSNKAAEKVSDEIESSKASNQSGIRNLLKRMFAKEEKTQEQLQEEDGANRASVISKLIIAAIFSSEISGRDQKEIFESAVRFIEGQFGVLERDDQQTSFKAGDIEMTEIKKAATEIEVKSKQIAQAISDNLLTAYHGRWIDNQRLQNNFIDSLALKLRSSNYKSLIESSIADSDFEGNLVNVLVADLSKNAVIAIKSKVLCCGSEDFRLKESFMTDAKFFNAAIERALTEMSPRPGVNVNHPKARSQSQATRSVVGSA